MSEPSEVTIAGGGETKARSVESRARELAASVARSLAQGRVSTLIDSLRADRVEPSRTLVVTGFWRSGTTWLQQVLAETTGAKTVFEPFHFAASGAREILARGQPHRRGDNNFLELHMPFCPGETLGDPLRGHFESALRASLPGRWSRFLRRSVGESLRARVVMKCVRAPLFLRAAQRTFRMPVVHIYRDPRAILSSIRWTDWEWLFDHLSLREQLLAPEDGRRVAFERWEDEIARCDEAGRTARVAAYWALTESFLAASYSETPDEIRFLRYEELRSQGIEGVVRILESLGLEAVSNDPKAFDRDSATTSLGRRGVEKTERIGGWRKNLSASEIATIESVALRFGLDDRLSGAELGEREPAQ